MEKLPKGGARPGAGRKPVAGPADPLVRKSVTLRESDIRRLEVMGDGNLSAGIRRLLQESTSREPYHAQQENRV